MLIRPLAALVLLVWLTPAAAAQPLLTLEEALDQALSANPTLRTARATEAIAQNDATVGNAGFLPALTASAGYTGTLSNTEQAFVNGETQEVTGALATRRTAGTTLRWTAFDGLGRRFATLGRLEAEADAQAARAEVSAQTLAAAVLVGYYDLVRAQQQQAVLEEAVAISSERLRIAEVRLDLGSAAELEVRQARVDLNTDRASLLRQEAALVASKAAFNRLLARPVGTAFTVQPDLDVDPGLDEAALTEAVQVRNPELRQAGAALEAARLAQREVAAERFPQLDVQVGVDYGRLEAESGFLTANRSTDLVYGATLSYSLFDGFDRRRRAENATLRTRSAALAVEDVEATLAAEMTALLARYRTSLALIALEEENLDAVRLNVEVALERFRLGTITSVELREVQEQLILAESRLLTARFEAKQAETELRRLGGLLPTGGV